jgi:hypothetical protein
VGTVGGWSGGLDVYADEPPFGVARFRRGVGQNALVPDRSLDDEPQLVATQKVAFNFENWSRSGINCEKSQKLAK